MRPPTSTPPWLAARGLLSGALCAFGTTWAHAAVAGHPVGPVALVVVAAASVGACFLLCRRSLGLGALIGVCVVGQTLAHAAMALGGAHAMSSMDSMGAHDGAHGSGLLSALTTGGLPMLLGHVAVALVTALLARGGEQALLDLARAAAHHVLDLLLPTLPAAVVPDRPARTSRGRDATPDTGRRLVGATGSRAPPRRGGVLVPA